jgi:signal transduction histidine kinase
MVSYGISIAHEIKNALAGLYGPAQFMTIYVPEDLMKIHDKYLKGVTPPVAGQKLSDIIAKMKSHGQLIYGKADEIRVIAKTAEGTLSSDEEMFEDISVKVIWDSSKSEARTGNCRLISYLPDQFVAYGNVVLLQRVFVNLINNAVEAMNERRQAEQEISLHCEYKQLDNRKGAYFEFHDNGRASQRASRKKSLNRIFNKT